MHIPPLPVGLLLAGLLGLAAGPARAEDGGEDPPSGRALRTLVETYLEADEPGRRRMREEADRRYRPLEAKEVEDLREDLLDAAFRQPPKITRRREGHLLGDERGRYLVEGRPDDVLMIGLHGGGAGAGSADAAAGAFGGGGWWWLFPEVLEKTERGWTTSGTEAFVIALVEAAKRTGKVDPDRVYLVGHSMGGFGAWTLGAHHADVFAGVGAYAGGPVPIWRSPEDHTVVGIQPGVLPNLANTRLFVYQSLDDPQVPPAANVFATAALTDWKARHPDLFDVRYQEVDGRGHAAPEEGYLPSLRWLAERRRDPHPRHVLWQPVLAWKHQHFWLWWARPERESLLEAEIAEDGSIDIRCLEGSGDTTGLSVLLPADLVDLEEEVVVRVDGEERFRGRVPRTLSTMLLTLPRYDAGLLFEARVDLD